MRKRVILSVIFSIVFFSAFSFSALAFELDTTKASAEGYYLYNIENDLVMAEHNSSKKISPSATVKMMTGIIAIEANLDPNDIITVTAEMAKIFSGRTMKLKAGDRLTVDDLLYSTLCGSYNDAAIVLAMSVCPTLSEFIERMNDKAAELGMKDTNYMNVTGIDSDGMETTIYDTLQLCKYLSQNDRFVDICATKSYTLSTSSTCSVKTITNRSTLLAANPGMSNFSTGSSGTYTNSTVLYYKDGELSFIAIVMNATPYDEDSTNYAEYFSKKLFGHAFNDYSYQTIYSEGSVLTSLPVKYSISSDDISLYLEYDLKLYLPKSIDPQNDLQYSQYIYGDELKAPISKGDTVGSLTVFYDGVILATVPIVAGESVSRNGFLYLIDSMTDYLSSRAFIITVIAFLLLMLGFYFFKKRKLEKMYKMRSKYNTNANKSKKF